jgi:rod shape-determining protein MreB
VVSRSQKVGGYDLDDAITTYLRTSHRMAVGTQTAEEIKLQIGSALQVSEERETFVRGRDLTSGLPREVVLTSAEVRAALAPPVAEMLSAVHAALEECPPELAADITRHGIVLTGGGALLEGFAERVAQETGMEVTVAHDPLLCVALGAGQTLEELDRIR